MPGQCALGPVTRWPRHEPQEVCDDGGLIGAALGEDRAGVTVGVQLTGAAINESWRRGRKRSQLPPPLRFSDFREYQNHLDSHC